MSIETVLRERLAKLKSRLGPLVPPHAFVLTRDRLVHVSAGGGARGARPAGGGMTVRSVALPAGALRDGPCGVPVAGPGLADAVGSLLGSDAKANGTISGASLSVPDDFVRAVAVDVDPGGEKNAREVEEVLQWKLDRAFGGGAPPLRVSWQAAGPMPSAGTRIIGIGTTEEAAATWEAAFAAKGIRIGLIAPEVLAVAPLARAALEGTGIFVWANGGTVSTAFFERGALRFLRSKPEGPSPDEAVQEIRLFASYVSSGAPGAATNDLDGPMVAAPDASEVISRFREFRQESGAGAAAGLRDVFVRRGLPPVEDPSVLAGIGLLTGEELRT